MFRLTTITAAAALFLTSNFALAQDVGVPVTVKVIQADGTPIPTAVVRHPQEAERHRVNTATGEWTESVLYMQDGSEFIFQKGTTLELEVSAPGYVNQKIRYLIKKKKKNIIPVVLQPMEMEEEDEDFDGPVIQFGRDKPID